LLRALSTIAEVDAASWDALLAPGDAPFLCHRYLLALESSGVTGEDTAWQPHHLGWFENGKLVAAAAAYQKRESGGEVLFEGAWARAAQRLGVRYDLRLVLGIPWSAAPGHRLMVGTGPDAPARRAHFLEQLVAHAADKQMAAVICHFIHPDERATLLQRHFMPRPSVQYVWRTAGEKTFEEFLARFHARRRKQLKRELRMVGEMGFTITTRRGAQVDPELAWRLHSATLARYANPSRAMPLKFFEALTSAFPKELELACAARGGEDLAGAINLRVGDALYGRYWGALVDEPYLHFAVCLYHPLEEGIPNGLATYHPGAGGEHKLTRGFGPELVDSAYLLFDERLRAQVQEYLAHEKAALEAGLPLWKKETGFKL
jgi:predicted N-acyltransferase